MLVDTEVNCAQLFVKAKERLLEQAANAGQAQATRWRSPPAVVLLLAATWLCSRRHIPLQSSTRAESQGAEPRNLGRERGVEGSK